MEPQWRLCSSSDLSISGDPWRQTHIKQIHSMILVSVTDPHASTYANGTADIVTVKYAHFRTNYRRQLIDLSWDENLCG